MNNYILLSEKPWHGPLFDALKGRQGERWEWIKEKKLFTLEQLASLHPEKIFIPHWSYIITKDIFTQYTCIAFHMTDLPYGRGGSPLQNLIARGLNETKVSAIRVDEGIDTGDVYLKRPMSLLGTAEEIFIRMTTIIQEMIEEIIRANIIPQPQQGEVVTFKRRRLEDGNIGILSELKEAFDHIRMLDAEGYPPAFLETDHFKLEFKRASLKSDQSIIADVKITKK